MASTIIELVAKAKADTADAERDEREYSDTAKAMLEAAREAGRQNLTADETARFETAMSKKRLAGNAVRRARETLAELTTISAEEADLTRRSNETRPGATAPASRNHVERVSVISEARTYNKGNDATGRQFLMDVARGSIFNDVQANERLARHMNEERIERPGFSERAAGDATTSAFGVGLVVPAYLADMYAPAVANMRPFADQMNKHPLPPTGMTLNLSAITTPTSAALQATQLTAVSSTSLAETDLVIQVQTFSGSQNVSRQAIERGVGIEDVTFGDLQKRVATALESTIITQATTGLSATAGVVTYTDASPTPALLWPNLFMAQSKLEQALLAQARVDLCVMHNRRFNWLASGVGSTWPFLGSLNSGVAPQQGAMQLTNEYGAGIRAVLANGLKVVVSANVPTTTGGTQDEIYIVASEEAHLWEDSVTMIRAEQPNAANLGILLVCYEYAGYTFDRYALNPYKITGTGLAAPAGF